MEPTLEYSKLAIEGGGRELEMGCERWNPKTNLIFRSTMARALVGETSWNAREQRGRFHWDLFLCRFAEVCSADTGGLVKYRSSGGETLVQKCSCLVPVSVVLIVVS